MRNIEEYILNNDLSHTTFEANKFFQVRNIFSHLSITLNEELLLEGSGIYNGCYALAKYMNNIIFDNNNDDIIINTSELNFYNILHQEKSQNFSL